MSTREELRLRDIIDAIGTIRSHVGGVEFGRKTSDAVLYNVVVIGEGSRSDSLRSCVARRPRSHGHGVVGLRNLVAHEYFRVDLEVIETIIAEQLEQLEESAKRLLERLE